MGRKLLLEHINVPGINTFDVYRSKGGYASVEKALKMAPNDIVEEVKKSGLRGRGGAVSACHCGRHHGGVAVLDGLSADPEATVARLGVSR